MSVILQKYFELSLNLWLWSQLPCKYLILFNPSLHLFQNFIWFQLPRLQVDWLFTLFWNHIYIFLVGPWSIFSHDIVGSNLCITIMRCLHCFCLYFCDLTWTSASCILLLLVIQFHTNFSAFDLHCFQISCGMDFVFYIITGSGWKHRGCELVGLQPKQILSVSPYTTDTCLSESTVNIFVTLHFH